MNLQRLHPAIGACRKPPYEGRHFKGKTGRFSSGHSRSEGLTSGSPRRGAGSNCRKPFRMDSLTSMIAAMLPERPKRDC